MAKSLRDQFKATQVSDLKKVVQEDDSKIVSGGKRTDFLEIKDGLNKFRIFPKHPEEKNFYHIRGVHWMTVEDDNGDDVRRTVLNAKSHAGWTKDPIEEYINFVKKNLSSSDADDANKIKKMVSWNDGITLQTSWICYANKMTKGSPNEFGILEFKKTVRDALNNESIIEDEDESISVDPFTDPDDGKPVLITYNGKAKKAADYYKVQLSKTAVPLSDDELEKFSKLTPLSQLPMLNYNEEMFELALNGLQHFDAEHEIDLFDTDEFQEIIEELREQFNEVEEKPKSKSKSTKNQVIEEDEDEEDEDVVEDEESEDGDEFDSLDRTELKKYISKNGLDISIKKSMSDDDIRDLIREAINSDESDEEVEEDEDESEDETPVKSSSTKPKPKTLEEVKAELRKKQGK